MHKSQGSEFPYCVIPLVGSPSMLMTRNILYTAITRAKKMVIIVGTKEHVRRMTENDRQQLRFTGLRGMLCGYLT
ncbi:MAG: ATP-binding domain-containing protein [Clostridia bacterium]